MVAVRNVYNNTNPTTVSTSSTSYVSVHNLDFVPSKNNANVAIFWSAPTWSSDPSFSDAFLQVRLVSNGNFVLQQTNIDMQDSTDVMLRTGMCVLKGLSNVSVHTVDLALLSESGSYVASTGVKNLTAIELGANDHFSASYSQTTLSTSWSTISSVTVPEGRWAFFASAGPSDSDSVPGLYNRILQRCLLSPSSVYGFVGEIRGDVNNDIEYYYYHMTANTIGQGSKTFSYQAGDDSTAGGAVRYVNVLALKLDDWPTSYSNHDETRDQTSSTSPVDKLSGTFSLSKSQPCFTSFCYAAVHNDSTTSGLHRFLINGAAACQASSFEPDPTDGGGAGLDFDGISEHIQWGGYNGVHTLPSGSNTLKIQHWVENGLDITGTGRASILVLGAESGFAFNVRDSGTWKETQQFWTRDAGTWKSAQILYVRDAGTWKPVVTSGDGFIGSFQSATSDFTSNPSSPPPPPPPPAPSPGGGTCVGTGTLITMWDGTKKPIEKIMVGDIVKTLTGVPGTVLQNKPVPLSPARRMMRLFHPDGSYLRFSDDHDMWVDIDGTQQWGVYNYNWWLYEARDCYDEEECPATPLIWYNHTYNFATDYGWHNTRAEWEIQQDPNEIIWGVKLDQGAGYIADGFVIISEGCTSEDIKDVNWQGIK